MTTKTTRSRATGRVTLADVAALAKVSPITVSRALRGERGVASDLTERVKVAAQELGYDSCPMDGFDFDAVSQLLNLPADHIPVMFVAVGKPLQAAFPRGGQLTLDEVMIRNRF